MSPLRAALAAACVGPVALAIAAQAANAGTAAATAPDTPAAACELIVSEHRSARLLLRVPLPDARLRIGFVHSVLGTPVEDHYVHRGGAWHLVEERFEGQGYGLPHAAAPGERLETDGATSRLRLDRRVDPLVVRPLPAQRMRVLLDDGRQWLLGDLARTAVQLSVAGC